MSMVRRWRVFFFYFYFYPEFSERMVAAMRLRNLNAKQLSNQLGKSPKTIESWVVGKHKPRMDNLTALGVTLGVSMDYLHGVSDEFS